MRPEKILVVEDNELLRLLMMHLLLKEFEHVIVTGTGIEAVKQIEENFYQFILLDKKLPDMDGFKVLAYIREKWPRSRVVMITSDADDRTRQEALNGGAFEFFEKPFDIHQLKAALRGIRVFKSMKARVAEKYRGGTYNLSNSGMLMITDAVLACGTTVDILLHTSDAREIPLKGKVVRTADSDCKSLQSIGAKENMKHAVGIQLVDPPSDYYSFFDSLIP